MLITRCVACAMAIGFGMAVHAQTSITPEILAATAILTPEQNVAVKNEAMRLVQILIDSEDSQIRKAHDDLVDPVRPSSSPFFRSAWSTEVSNELSAKAMMSDRYIVRFAAMMVATHLDRSVAGLIGIGLKDKNPAVRYWAGKSVNKIAAELPADSQLKLRMTVQAAIATESSDFVIRQLLLGLVDLEGREEVLTALNQRLGVHEKKPARSVRPERECFQKLFQKLVQDSQRRPVSTDLLKNLTALTCRYLEMCAKLLHEEKVPKEMAPEYWLMFQPCERILRWSVSQLGPLQRSPPDIGKAVQRRSTAEIQLIVGEWKTFLLGPPASLRPEDLAVKPAKL